MTNSKGNPMFSETDFKKKSVSKKKSVWKSPWLWLVVLVIIGGVIFAINKFKQPDEVISTETIESTETISKAPTEEVVDSTTNGQIIIEKDKVTTIDIEETESESQSASKIDLILTAKKTIRGDYGNGANRKEALGSNYSAVQNQVNEFYRLGQLQW